jgi:hypothetical protein
MARIILSIADAKRAAQDPTMHLLWITEADAAEFDEAGWVRLEPPLDGGVMFLHRERQQLAIGLERNPRRTPRARA